ncbi:MAG: hypothetical protein COT81_01280 [Candidatus Buchananbacteria bacterium CG10_big_fil_rev_8_21_14_0_10_42_9]|uniref:Cation/H+ exchanger transmembrane domain-containing protein n=1 Tax=Candidatus Buchananbacteria bacterium CG10_big_fil_rev_8_21_14_0_10_42_9 TaxID=1974526 RepID=A0A2H0W1Z4_9BACT|nr:MAG: hypothetical protein COT81_01280 [Candidatus Buchananbacteria bacterium CG10_big_fil_rev_8_21_14_0_10_42_9]
MATAFFQSLIFIAFALLGSVVGNRIAIKFKQPRVLGMLLAGIVIGILFNWTQWLQAVRHDEHGFIPQLAEFAAMVLLFRAGLEGNVKSMLRDAKTSIWVALIGVIMPLVGAYLLMQLLGYDFATAFFTGGILVATSVGVTTAVLSEFKLLQATYAKIIISAAVLDDVLGLIVLMVAQSFAGDIKLDIFTIIAQIGTALAFIVLLPLLGYFFVAPLMKQLRALDPQANSKIIFGFMAAYGAGAAFAGLAPIVGAYFAGVALEEAFFRSGKDDHEKPVEQRVLILEGTLAPIFFVYATSIVNPVIFLNFKVIALGLSLTVIAVLGKIVAGAVVKSWIVGVGMIPRGEVGIIFATLGFQLKIITQNIFSAAMLMVILTTLITPPLLKYCINCHNRNRNQAEII